MSSSIHEKNGLRHGRRTRNLLDPLVEAKKWLRDHIQKNHGCSTGPKVELISDTRFQCKRWSWKSQCRELLPQCLKKNRRMGPLLGIQLKTEGVPQHALSRHCARSSRFRNHDTNRNRKMHIFSGHIPPQKKSTPFFGIVSLKDTPRHPEHIQKHIQK